MYISLLKHALEHVHLLFRVSDSSKEDYTTSSSFILQLHSDLHRRTLRFSVRPRGSSERVVSLHVTRLSLDKCWALSRPSDAQLLLGSTGQWAGPGAQLLHDDWMICLRLNPFLIDSGMSESAILKLLHSPEHFKVM